METLIRSYCQAAGISLPEGAFSQLALHWSRLMQANGRFNLTAITEPEVAAEKHYLDCLLALPVLDAYAGSLCDLGSGGGFPGLVLAIARPERPITLVEATEKKAAFLRQVGEELGLDQIRVVCARAEEIGRDPAFRAQFAVVTARALAGLPVLLEYGLPLLEPGGMLLAYKGLSAPDEVQQAAQALRILQGRWVKTHAYALPSGDSRCLVQIENTGPTPDAYPRRPGMPSKRPL